MTLAVLFGWLTACSGDGPEPKDPTGTEEPTGPTGSPTAVHTGTVVTCEPSVEIGTGVTAFEALPERLDMIHGPQGGWHIVTAVQLCDLGTDATLSFRAHRVSDDLEVGGSGTVQRILLPDGPCCYSAVDVYTYLLVPGYDRPADALHEQSVRLDVDVTLPDGEVWSDSAEVVMVDSTR